MLGVGGARADNASPGRSSDINLAYGLNNFLLSNRTLNSL